MSKVSCLKLETAKGSLLAGGGDFKVPCLRIGEGKRGFQWMYESRDIIGYLEGRLVVQ